MTLGEIMDEILYALPEGAVDPAELTARIDRAQKRCARELRIPVRVDAVNDVTGGFTLAPEALSGGLLHVRLRDDETNVPIVTPEWLSRNHPDWRDWDKGDTTLYIAHDSREQPEILPVPLPKTSVDYLITYVVEPDSLEELGDEPWNGLFAEYHNLLVDKVVSDVLLKLENPAYQVHYMNYLRAMQQFFVATSAPSVGPRNLLWDSL